MAGMVKLAARRVGRYLERQGLLERDAENSHLALGVIPDDPMAQLLGHSITYRIAVGPQTGRKVFALQTLPACEPRVLILPILNWIKSCSLYVKIWSIVSILKICAQSLAGAAGQRTGGSMKQHTINHLSFTRAIWMAALLMLSGGGPAWGTSFPGPDDFGYSGAAIGSSLRDISTTGSLVTLGDDQVSDVIDIPFDFDFYGVDYNALYISSNGFVTFTATSGQGFFKGQPLPSADSSNNVDNVIAPFWEDLNGPPGNIRFETLGSTGSQEFVVGFYAVPHFPNHLPVTFELILHEGSNAIELQYGSAPSDGGTRSIGIENADGTIGLQVALGNFSFNNEGFLITHPFAGTFAEFTLDKADMKYRDDAKLDEFKIKGSFTLNEVGHGINIENEPVTIEMGGGVIEIPAGSFYTEGDKLRFKGEIGDVKIDAKFKVVGFDSYEFDVKVKHIDLAGSGNPVTLKLRIGTNFGATVEFLEGHLKLKDRGEDREIE
jgi:hypothetical protein